MAAVTPPSRSKGAEGRWQEPYSYLTVAALIQLVVALFTMWPFLSALHHELTWDGIGPAIDYPSSEERLPFLLFSLPSFAGSFLLLSKKRLGVFVSIVAWIVWYGFLVYFFNFSIGTPSLVISLFLLVFPAYCIWLIRSGWGRIKWN